jgi:hypothetical protein
MGRRVLEVELAGMGSLVRGYGSRELVMSVTGRAPVWSSIRRGWSLQEVTARDVVAAAEAQGFDVVITGPRASDRNPANTPRPMPDPGGGLW